MAILTTGNTFSTGDQVTATKLNNVANAATFDTPADDVTVEVSSNVLQVKDGGLTSAKLSTGSPTWDSSSNVTVNGQLLISGASAGQITFPAVQNASPDANTLDDYEEGTWTPSIGGTATYTSRTGTYTKIGRLVFIQCSINVNSIGTGSTYIISGVPFAAVAECSLAVSSWSSAASSFVSVGAKADGTQISMQGTTSAAASISSTPTFFGSGTAVDVAGCYYV